MDKTLVFALTKRTGCRGCEVACTTAHEGLACTALSRIKVVPFEDQDFFYGGLTRKITNFRRF